MAFHKRAHSAFLVESDVARTGLYLSKVASSQQEKLLTQYHPDKWLLSHVSIMASVDVDVALDTDAKFKDFLIKPSHEAFINNNNDSWERKLLAATYQTFVGANNYVEHVQLPELSKGKVVDAVLREVVINDKNETTLYVDILIATSWKFKDLCQKIIDAEYNATSMGCQLEYSICTQCGNVAVDETQLCKHVRYYKGRQFYDSMGVSRKVAELCGHHSDPSSVRFIDASWVKVPAFKGAVVRNVIKPPQGIVVPNTDLLQTNVLKESSLKDEHHAELNFGSDTPPMITKAAQSKAASEKEAAPLDDSQFPPADDSNDKRFNLEDGGDQPVEAQPEDKGEGTSNVDDIFNLDNQDGGQVGDTPAGDQPEGDQPTDTPGDPASDPAAEQPGDAGQEGGSPDAGAQEEQEVSVEDAEKTTIEEIQNTLRDNILMQVKQDLISRTRKETGVGPGRGGADPYSSESDTNDSLFKWACSNECAESLESKYSISIDDYENRPSEYAILALLNTPSGTAGARSCGFSDLEILSAAQSARAMKGLDHLYNSEVLAICKPGVRLGDKTDFFTDLILDGVRTEGRAKLLWEASRIIS